MIKQRPLPPDIAERLERLAARLKQDQRVLFAYLFGSLASGVLKPLSDVDIAVFLDSADVTPETKLEVVGMISDTLGTDEVDVVILNTAPVSLTGRILKRRTVLADNQPWRRHLFESRTMREFFDFNRSEQEILTRRFA